MRAVGLVLVIVSSVLVGSASAADRKSPVEKLAADAAESYRAGEYKRAAEQLERAYKIQPLSALLYNLAKAYEKLGETDKAADLYARYAASDDAEPRLKEKAEQRASQLREPVTRPEKSSGRREPPKPQPTEPEPQPKAQPRVEPQPKPEPQPEPKPDPMAEQRGRERAKTANKAAGLTLVSVGVAALAAAIGLSVSAMQLQRQFAASTDQIDKSIALNAAKPQALAADVLYAVGAVSVGVSIYFLYAGFRPEKERRVAVAPLLGPGIAGMTLGGSF